ncbi:MAG: ribosomal protein S18-alanine N-acetyltransferase [Pseudomonadota bacterium]
MSKWRVRPARLDDAPSIVALESGAFGAASWGASAVADGLTAPHVAALIAFPEGEREAAGFAFWRPLGEEAEILSIGVAPTKQRRGCARALLAEIIAQACGRGVRKLFLEVAVANAPAEALYATLGFERIGRRKRYYRNGGDALVMRLNL